MKIVFTFYKAFLTYKNESSNYMKGKWEKESDLLVGGMGEYLHHSVGINTF